MTERQLVAATLRGDGAAFGGLVAGYQRLLIASARHFTGNADDAEDLAQEALLAAYRNLPTLADHGKFRPWLLGILRHKCLSYLQQRQPDAFPLDDVADTLAAPLPADYHDLGALIDQLPLAAREVIILRYLQELSYREIAALLEISEEAARVRCLRARDRLRTLAAERDEEQLKTAMAGLLAAPLTDTFHHRVMQEVVIMGTVGKGTATGAGILAVLLSWKGAAVLGGVLLIGAGVATPHLASWWQARQATPAVAQSVSGEHVARWDAGEDPTSPKQVAEYFLTALAKGDFDNAELIYQGSLGNRKAIEGMFKGLTIISIGEPIANTTYGPDRWFVPYEIQLKNGQIRNMKLSVRNDNPMKRWEVDGGI